MSSKLAAANRNAYDMLFDKHGEPKYRQELKWKTTNRHKDSYEAYEIPTDFDDFFMDFGGIEHPLLTDENKLPLKITKLAKYQSDFAKLDYGVAKKCNKIGMTTSELLSDFHTRLLPQKSGNDCLFAASSENLSNNLLSSLKNKVANSKKYRGFALKVSQREESKEEANMHRMIIADPWRDVKEGHILALGTSLSGAYSRMDVNRVHISDPSRMIILAQDDFFAGLVSRISNTEGQIKIEGVPGTRSGWFWKLCQATFDEDTDAKQETEQLSGETDDHAKAMKFATDDYLTDYEFPKEIKDYFTAVKITINDAVEERVISVGTRAFLKATLSPALYRRTCMAEFPLDEDAVFRPADNIGTHVTGW